ncbi:thioredoxin family protein [Limnohabitans sp.]|nr:thioredoxin family protein [Limnohabitans sp.]
MVVFSSSAMDMETYTSEGLRKRQMAGEAVSLSFYAKWCATCLMQEKVFKSFKGDASVPGTLLVVDYDQSRKVMQKLHVHAQSTLIVYKGHVERHRSGGLTDPQALKQALQSAK